MTGRESAQSWQDIHYSARDGLRLYGRRYGAQSSSRRPLLCLPGLTRNCRDFHDLALALSRRQHRPRDVYCLDYRGRGRSEHDRNWRNYAPYVELLDTLDFMTVAGLHQAAVLGTSRGGIILMLMAVLRPAVIGVAILNDIGPEIETSGLARIIGYVGRTPTPGNWDDAVRIVRQINGHFFPRVSDAEWGEIARQWFDDDNGRPTVAYDANLAKAMAQIDLARRLPDTWPQFLALGQVPTLAIRGENSDLLSQATFERMEQRHPQLATLIVEAEGHAPLLRDEASIAAVAEFLEATENALAPTRQRVQYA